MRDRLNWIRQDDTSSCGPLSIGAALLLMQGIQPTQEAMRMPGATTSETSSQLRASQMLDIAALLANLSRKRWPDVGEGIVTDPALIELLRKAHERVDVLWHQ